MDETGAELVAALRRAADAEQNSEKRGRANYKNRGRTFQPDLFQAIRQQLFRRSRQPSGISMLKATIRHLNMVQFAKAAMGARTFTELQSEIQKGLGRTGLMTFMELDHSAVLRKESGRDSPRIMRFIVGNPLIMKEMAKHVPDTGSYAPVTILVDERADGVHVSYDSMASFLAPMEMTKPWLSPSISIPKSKPPAGVSRLKQQQKLRQAE